MKVILLDDSHYEIFLNSFYENMFDIDSKEALEDTFRSLFHKLEKDYQLNIRGYYDIVVYKDPYYGIVLEILKEDLDYYDFQLREVDMRIQISKENSFLYEIEDLFCLPSEILEKGCIYLYHNRYYFRLREYLDFSSGAYLMEHAVLHFKDTKPILEYGHLLN